MSRPTHVIQPGPPARERYQAAAGWGRAFAFDVVPGRLLLEAVRDGFAAAGFSSGVATFDELAFGPFGYVMPSTSPTPKHAAYYSAAYRPAGISRTMKGALTFGKRDGAAFFHGHAIWREADGRISGGHILPEETVLAAPACLQAFGLSGVTFDARPDDEINFKVFGPVATTRRETPTERRAYGLRLRPNQDYATAIEAFCQRRGIRHARVIGGVGSTIGALFDDGRCIEPFVTEIFLSDGKVVADAAGRLEAQLTIGLVDMNGQVAEGRLLRGQNPILMTIECVIVVED